MKVNYIWIICAALVAMWLLFLGTVGSAYWVHILLLAAAVLAIGYTLNRPTS